MERNAGRRPPMNRSIGYSVLAVAWLIVCTLTCIHFRTVIPGPRESFSVSVLKFATCYAPWLFLTPPLFRLEARYSMFRPFCLKNLGRLLLIGIALCLFSSLVALNIIPAFSFVLAGFNLNAHFITRIRITELELQAIIFIATVGTSAFLRHQTELQEIERERAELSQAKAELQAALGKAELETLRMRLNPHFLFNCLQNISALAGENSKAASTMLARLGDLLRVALRSDYQATISLREELRLTEAYLSIEQIRFGDRLSVLFDLDPEAANVQVPSLLLQPLVENAIKHGLAREGLDGVISIHSRVADSRLTLTVRDSGQGVESKMTGQPGSGIGLGATRERLWRMYGEAQHLTLFRLPEGGTEVVISLPAPEVEQIVEHKSHGSERVASRAFPNMP